jgi:hypothetical protein
LCSYGRVEEGLIFLGEGRIDGMGRPRWVVLVGDTGKEDLEMRVTLLYPGQASKR